MNEGRGGVGVAGSEWRMADGGWRESREMGTAKTLRCACVGARALGFVGKFCLLSRGCDLVV